MPSTAQQPERGGPRHAGGQGQASVEFGLTLPFVLGLALLALAVAGVARDHVLLAAATRDAARAASLSADPAAGAAAGSAATSLDPARLSFVVRTQGGIVSVRGSYQSRLVVPLLGITRTVPLNVGVAMRIEYRDGG